MAWNPMMNIPYTYQKGAAPLLNPDTPRDVLEEDYICKEVLTSVPGKTGFSSVRLEKMDGSQVTLLLRNITGYRLGAHYKVKIKEK